MDFLIAWPRVEYPLDIDYMAKVRERALNGQPLVLAQQYGFEGIGLLVQICWELQQDAGRGAFFLSARIAGELLDVAYKTASRMLLVLVEQEILRVEKKGGTKDAPRDATRFRFIGDTRTDL